jgi:hypothetical protein
MVRILEVVFTRLASVPQDKLAHAAYAVPGYLFLYVALRLLDMTEHVAESALALMVLVAALKELYDWVSNKLARAAVHGVELFDFLATTIGAASAYACTWVARL